jgi:hypothetical protein
MPKIVGGPSQNAPAEENTLTNMSGALVRRQKLENNVNTDSNVLDKKLEVSKIKTDIAALKSDIQKLKQVPWGSTVGLKNFGSNIGTLFNNIKNHKDLNEGMLPWMDHDKAIRGEWSKYHSAQKQIKQKESEIKGLETEISGSSHLEKKGNWLEIVKTPGKVDEIKNLEQNLEDLDKKGQKISISKESIKHIDKEVENVEKGNISKLLKNPEMKETLRLHSAKEFSRENFDFMDLTTEALGKGGNIDYPMLVAICDKFVDPAAAPPVNLSESHSVIPHSTEVNVSSLVRTETLKARDKFLEEPTDKNAAAFAECMTDALKEINSMMLGDTLGRLKNDPVVGEKVKNFLGD